MSKNFLRQMIAAELKAAEAELAEAKDDASRMMAYTLISELNRLATRAA